MLSYDARSTKFITLDEPVRGEWGKGVWESTEQGVELGDCLFMFDFGLGRDSKVYIRTRRKFWEDVSLRGGQYSALMLVLTAIYSLFQGPFQEMKYGLKFAQMRAKDGFSSETEQSLYYKVNK